MLACFILRLPSHSNSYMVDRQRFQVDFCHSEPEKRGAQKPEPSNHISDTRRKPKPESLTHGAW